MSKDTGPIDYTIKLGDLCDDVSSASMMAPKGQAPVVEPQHQGSRKRRRTVADNDSDDDNEAAVLQSRSRSHSIQPASEHPQPDSLGGPDPSDDALDGGQEPRSRKTRTITR